MTNISVPDTVIPFSSKEESSLITSSSRSDADPARILFCEEYKQRVERDARTLLDSIKD